MLYLYKEVREKYKENYAIQKALNKGELFKIESGLYSDSPVRNIFEIISKKYPQAIFTKDVAFYMHGLTDVIPQMYYVATKRNASRIKIVNVTQVFEKDLTFNIGKTQMEIMGVKINIYDKERMLIEVIRNQNTMPFDYYKEIINSYRKISNQLDMRKLESYIEKFKNDYFIFKTIQKEVF